MSRAAGEAWDLREDLRDMQIHLSRTFHDFDWIPFSVDRHHGSREDEIAYVVIALSDKAARRRVRSRAKAALRHLGYTIRPQGGIDLYAVAPYAGDVSAHEIIRALARFKDLGHRSRRSRRASIPGLSLE